MNSPRLSALVLCFAVLSASQVLAQVIPPNKNYSRNSKLRSWISGGGQNLVYSNVTGGFIGGGIANQVGNTYASILGGANNINTSSFAAIGGGSQNMASNNSAYAVVAGGLLNAAMFATHSVIGGGSDNRTLNNWTTICGGANNTNQAGYGTIAGGTQNTASNSATGAFIAGGFQNTVGGSYSSAGGCFASAPLHGQDARASSRFADTGDGQSSVYTVYGYTTDANPKNLTLDLNDATSRLKVAPGQTMAFEVLVAGRSSAGVSFAKKVGGVIKNVAGTTTLPASALVFISSDGAAAAWNAVPDADNANDALVVQVTGAAATQIRWVATVRTSEVKFP